MKKSKQKFPEKVACCSLCLCMAISVFSSVALVYLTGKVVTLLKPNTNPSLPVRQ